MSKPDFRKTLGAPGFDWMGHYLSGVDGTGYFSSSKSKSSSIGKSRYPPHKWVLSR